ncbi:MAG: DUF359 domain-containing protein [Thermoplasmata archaeon]|nr:MAG: DUF359 domain-containing protein [Thermoplasmata archaeon]
MPMENTPSRSDKDFFSFSARLLLPDELRDELKVPLGKVVSESKLLNIIKNFDKVVTVGDLCSLTLYRMDVVPDIACVDFQTRRGEVAQMREEIQKIGQIVINVNNPAGEITRELWDAVLRAYKSPAPVRIEVLGEEDLAALPCIWLAPEGTAVVYGLPDVGLVVVFADSEVKMKVKDVLDKMI